MSGAFGSACACRRLRYLPDQTPNRLRALDAGDAAARPAARRPSSVAATAGARMGMRAARKAPASMMCAVGRAAYNLRSTKGCGLTFQIPFSGLSVSIITRFASQMTQAASVKQRAPVTQ